MFTYTCYPSNKGLNQTWTGARRSESYHFTDGSRYAGLLNIGNPDYHCVAMFSGNRFRGKPCRESLPYLCQIKGKQTLQVFSTQQWAQYCNRYRPQLNVFTPVCYSVHRGVYQTCTWADTLPGRHPPGQTHALADTPPGQTLPPGRHPQHPQIPPSTLLRHPSPKQMATAVDENRIKYAFFHEH